MTEMSSSRNPSPPPLTDAEREAITGDVIGDTVFSKRWVLDLLLELYKHQDSIYISKEEKQGLVKTNCESNHHDSSHTDSDNVDLIEKILDPDFENKLCQLWDMTANTDVALFLYEHDSKNILMDALKCTRSPRLMEICFGIIGNLFCVKEIRVSYSECEVFRKCNLRYLSVTDALSLVELTRLLCTALSCANCLRSWLQDLSENTHVEQLIYLLGNSLNIDLLSHVIEMLDIMFDVNDEALHQNVSSDGFVTGMIEAFSPLKENGKMESLVSLAHIFQTISTSNKGIETLSLHFNKCLNFMQQCLAFLGDDETMEISSNNRIAFHASVYSTLTCFIVDHREAVLNMFNENITFLKHFSDYLHNKLTEIHEDGLTATNRLYLTVCVEAFYQILELALSEEQFLSLKDFVHSEHFKREVLEMVQTINNTECLKDLQTVAKSLKDIVT